MMVKWEGEGPPDKGAWYEVLDEALGEDAGFYWVRFYREPGGWRFDLECRRPSGTEENSLTRADIGVALNVYTLLVESGIPLDPGWRPSPPSPPVTRARRPISVVPPAEPPITPVAPPAAPVVLPVAQVEPPVAQVEPPIAQVEPPVAQVEPPVAEAESSVSDTASAPMGEAPPPPSAEGQRPSGRRRRGRHRRKGVPAPLEPGRETTAESFSSSATPPEAARAAEPEPLPGPQPLPEAQPALAPRPTRWPRLQPAVVVSLSAVLLIAIAGWLSRDLLQSRPAPPPASSPSATVSQPPATAPNRPADLESVVPAPARIGATQRASERPRAQPEQTRTRRILLPTPTPAPTPALAPDPTPAPAEVPVSTDTASSTAGPVQAAAAEPAPTPSPVRRGALVDVNDPDLTRPVSVTQTRPRYPPFALQRRLSGTVSLRALVDETGAVAEVSLIRASPPGQGFEDAATRYVRTRVYKPATKQGVPVRVWLPITIEFRAPDR